MNKASIPGQKAKATENTCFQCKIQPLLKYNWQL